MRVYHHPYRRPYRLASSAGQIIRSAFMVCNLFLCKGLGVQGVGPLRSPTPCTHAVPRRPFVPHGPGTLAALATPWVQGLRPCTPSGRRAGSPASRTPRRAGRQACFDWGMSPSSLQPSHRTLAIRESAGGGVLVRPTSGRSVFRSPFAVWKHERNLCPCAGLAARVRTTGTTHDASEAARRTRPPSRSALRRDRLRAADRLRAGVLPLLSAPAPGRCPDDGPALHFPGASGDVSPDLALVFRSRRHTFG